VSVLLPEPTALGFADVAAGVTRETDVAIVGSGPGAASVARVLAEAGVSVVLLEEGPPRSRFRPNQANTARFHMQERGAMLAQGNNFVPVTAGRGVGGSTLINGALCFRAPAAVLDGWAEALGDRAWSAASLAPLFDEAAALLGVELTPDRIAGEHNRMVARGVAKLGYAGGLAPRNAPGCVGCGVCYYGCPSRGKASANLTLLPRAVAAGAVIQADTRVREVIVEGDRAVGVRGTAIDPDTGERGGDVVVRARHVVLGAGAIGTPRLLWSCGLAERLGPVGDGLHIHPGTAVLAGADTPIEMWKGATQGAYFHVPGVPELLPHTISLPPEAALVALGMVGDRLEEGMALLPFLAGLGIMISDKSTGSVRARSDGRADIRYDVTDGDLAVLKHGCVVGAEVMLAGGASWVTCAIRGAERTTDPKALEAAIAPATIRDVTMYAAHPMSTMRMGTNPATSVVDPSGFAHGLRGLSVADASVFPTSLGVNPQLTVVAVCTQLGRRLLATLGGTQG
jgi:choline dehydrogenase-like flavoprotein